MRLLFASILLASIFTACGSTPDSKGEVPNTPETVTPTVENDKSLSLTDSLANKKNAFLERASQEKIDSYNRGIEAVTPTLETAIKVGDKAPISPSMMPPERLPLFQIA